MCWVSLKLFTDHSTSLFFSLQALVVRFMQCVWRLKNLIIYSDFAVSKQMYVIYKTLPPNLLWLALCCGNKDVHSGRITLNEFQNMLLIHHDLYLVNSLSKKKLGGGNTSTFREFISEIRSPMRHHYSEWQDDGVTDDKNSTIFSTFPKCKLGHKKKNAFRSIHKLHL